MIDELTDPWAVGGNSYPTAPERKDNESKARDVAKQADAAIDKINELLDVLGAPRELSSRDVRALDR